MFKIKLFPKLQEYINALDTADISEERKLLLQPLIDYIRKNKDAGENIQLNFICTHNSRRSQFSQIWAQVAASCFGIKAQTYSGGVEVTAFNERGVNSLERTGFKIEKEGDGNPTYRVFFSLETEPVLAFSKLYDDDANPEEDFAAIMTCTDADANCPFIPGAHRISLPFQDPKAFDDTPAEAEKYDERSHQIATELFYVFSQIK